MTALWKTVEEFERNGYLELIINIISICSLINFCLLEDRCVKLTPVNCFIIQVSLIWLKGVLCKIIKRQLLCLSSE